MRCQLPQKGHPVIIVTDHCSGPNIAMSCNISSFSVNLSTVAICLCISGQIVTGERLIFLCGLKFRNLLRMESKLHCALNLVTYAVSILKTVEVFCKFYYLYYHFKEFTSCLPVSYLIQGRLQYICGTTWHSWILNRNNYFTQSLMLCFDRRFTEDLDATVVLLG